MLSLFFPARQLIEYQYGNGIDVVLGGGWRGFLPCGSVDPEGNLLKGSKCRKDNRTLTNEWLEKYNNSAVVWNKDELKKIDPDKVDHLLGKIFDGSHASIVSGPIMWLILLNFMLLC